MMRMINTAFKKTVKCKVSAIQGEVRIRFPKQLIGNIALQFEKGDREIVILRQWEVYLKGDVLEITRLK